MDTDNDELSLREAAQRWCDQKLVRDLDAAFAAVAQLRYLSPLPSRGLGQHEARVAAHNDRNRYVRRVQRGPARASSALLADFRRLLERGVVHLRGVQVHPLRQTTPTPIPGSWATDFRFDLKESAIDCADHRWVMVTASLQPKAADAGAQAFDAPVQDLVPGPAACVVPRRRGGRTKYEPLIEEALRARWDDIASKLDAGAQNRISYAMVATMLLKWLRTRYPQASRTNHLPSPHTIRTRVPKIYDRLMSEKPVQ